MGSENYIYNFWSEIIFQTTIFWFHLSFRACYPAKLFVAIERFEGDWTLLVTSTSCASLDAKR